MPVSLVVSVPQILVAQPAAAAEQHAGAGRAARRRIPASSTTPRSAPARRRTSPANCSSSRRASTWSTFPTRAAARRSPTRWAARCGCCSCRCRPRMQHVKAGRLKALAVTTLKRSAGRAGDSDGRRGARHPGLRGRFLVRAVRAGEDAAGDRRADAGGGGEGDRSMPEVKEKLLVQGAAASPSSPGRVRARRIKRGAEEMGST